MQILYGLLNDKNIWKTMWRERNQTDHTPWFVHGTQTGAGEVVHYYRWLLWIWHHLADCGDRVISIQKPPTPGGPGEGCTCNHRQNGAVALQRVSIYAIIVQ